MVGTEEIQSTELLSADDYSRVVHETIFECCKWDPQLEDTVVLSPFALILDSQTWKFLAQSAEKLAAETLAMEQELACRHPLHAELAIPRPISRAIRCAAAPVLSIARVMRFDFHLTNEGWRISEVNCDVPGGFIEASGFTSLVAEQYPGLVSTGDPAGILARSIARGIGFGGSVGLIHATAYTDDRQVMVYLSQKLEALGITSHLAAPDQVRWIDGRATLINEGEISAIMRFFPAEWLPNLSWRAPWRGFFNGSLTPQCNPGAALLVQSKRLPLVWDRLRSPSVTWRGLLPETRRPQEVDWQSDPAWIVKPALGRVGAGIGLPGVTSPKDWKTIRRSARWFARYWIAQRKFEALPVPTPLGMQYPCIGVYTVDGRACGIYGRIAERPLIDHRARDVAVLIPKGCETNVW